MPGFSAARAECPELLLSPLLITSLLLAPLQGLCSQALPLSALLSPGSSWKCLLGMHFPKKKKNKVTFYVSAAMAKEVFKRDRMPKL